MKKKQIFQVVNPQNSPQQEKNPQKCKVTRTRRNANEATSEKKIKIQLDGANNMIIQSNNLSNPDKDIQMKDHDDDGVNPERQRVCTSLSLMNNLSDSQTIFGELNTNLKNRSQYSTKHDDLAQYISYLKDRPCTKKGFYSYRRETLYWDKYESIIISTLAECCGNFFFFNSFINLYLYDNLKKLKDPKVIDQIMTKIKESKDPKLNIPRSEFKVIESESLKFYLYKRSRMRRTLKGIFNVKVLGSQDCNSNVSTCQIIPREKLAFNDMLATALIYSKIQGVDELDLTQHYILYDNVQLIFSALKANTSITKLYLNANKIGEEGCYWLAKTLYYNKSIADLDLSFNLLNDNALRAFNTSFKEMKYFDIEIDNFLRKKIKKCAEYFYQFLHQANQTHNLELTKINIANNSNFTYAAGAEISEILRNSPKLKWLNISRNNLESEGFSHIIETYLDLIIAQRTTLENLIAHNIKIEDSEILIRLAKVVSHPNCTLKCLVLSDNKLSPKTPSGIGIVEFLRGMGQNYSIDELLLLNCDIGNDLVDELCEMFKENDRLEKVGLYNNKIDDPVKFKKIMGMFTKKNDILSLNVKKSNIKDLDLSKNKCKLVIDEDFLKIIENLTLETIDISQNFELQSSETNLMSERFKEVTNRVQMRTKIIY